MVPRENNVLYGPVALECASIPTGTWRIKRPVVDSKCIGCKKCTMYCPCMAIEINEDKKIVIDYEYCKGCGICVTVCKFGAISMVDEKEKAKDEKADT